MSYAYEDKKIVCVISGAIENWQAMNAVGHLGIGLGARSENGLMGETVLRDASGTGHAGIARYGLIVKKADPATIRDILEAARQTDGVTALDFPREMLDTFHDDELRGSIRAKEEKDFDYLGVLLYGPTDVLKRLTKACSLWS